METTRPDDDRALFESTISALEAQIANAGVHLTIDSATRAAYGTEIKKMSDKLRADATARRITWAAAAKQAQETRNVIMSIMRARSTAIGRAFAHQLKVKGYTLNHLIAQRAAKMYGDAAVFSRLSRSKQNAIYAAIVTSAGKPDAAITLRMARLSYAGRGLLFLSMGVSVYNIATSPHKGTAIKKEIVTQGASITGGLAGGALAGLACGPGAPICVTVGAFVGGAMAAFGTSHFW